MSSKSAHPCFWSAKREAHILKSETKRKYHVILLTESCTVNDACFASHVIINPSSVHSFIGVVQLPYVSNSVHDLPFSYVRIMVNLC